MPPHQDTSGKRSISYVKVRIVMCTHQTRHARQLSQRVTAASPTLGPNVCTEPYESITTPNPVSLQSQWPCANIDQL